jgi:3-deoxy-D-manno-octulosonate 8-phosphate phosphatase (KDO 8-P phosphatase)
MSAIRLLALDVDGVLTDGRLTYNEHGECLKVFHVQDGLGMRLAQRWGIPVCIISARDSGALRQRLDDLGIEHRFLGCNDKLSALSTITQQLNLNFAEVAYFGDDLIDLPVLTQVGSPFTVPNAHPMVLERVNSVTQRTGGRGAVREVIDQLLAEQIGLDVAYADFIKPY